MLSLRRPPRPACHRSPAPSRRLARWAARAAAPVLAAAIGLTFTPASAAPVTPSAPSATAASATVGILANGTPLGSGTGLYPRAIRLQHNGAANGRVLASVVTFNGNNGIGAIHESTDGGATFRQVGGVADPESAGGQGLCCSTLFELPRQVGTLAPGTLLWAASSGADGQNRRMALRVWRSNDVGRTWSYLSTCATANGTGGLWEPEFSVAADGALVCHYADETDPAHNQKLAAARSYDGVTWQDRRNTVASSWEPDRPGMPMVRRLPDGTYFMSYEICNPGGQYQCVVHYRTSPDGWNWGDPASLGYRPETVDGKYFRAAPTIAWAPAPGGGANGRLLLIGQQLLNRDGTPAADSGRTILANTENGTGPWYEIEAPVHVAAPTATYCPNYSSPLLPSADGRTVLEIATDWDGGVCRPYVATGPVTGSGDAAGVVDGARYRLVNANSGHCLDVAADSRVAGGNVQQWTCNGLGPQAWTLRAHGDAFTLTGVNSGFCLDVENGSATPGANVRQWYCNAAAAQDWRMQNAGRGYYRLVVKSSGQCLDVSQGSRTAGANVQQWTCNGQQPQLWRLERL
ncbi:MULTISPECIES: RICIN domain-containing protein [unclassified Streptomyces]|uniref:RICIN domain-containing protein n=1 Tax=unclassified Streptomyces TaxID=2593676 RepID=UPI00225AF06C|nr:RICIN domain-containing protein [Streptomyces sp. NBC_01789]MCX4445549.1 RICIN domain-containing protein [Streptomyces sp. NBC_01789]